MNANQLKKRTKQFAHDCVKLTLNLKQTRLAKHIEGQLIRCSTSVAANYRAACLSQSQKAFIAKLSIVVEEVDECIFWIEFIKDENLTEHEVLNKVLNEAKELTSIFVASRKTLMNKLNR